MLESFKQEKDETYLPVSMEDVGDGVTETREGVPVDG